MICTCCTGRKSEGVLKPVWLEVDGAVCMRAMPMNVRPPAVTSSTNVVAQEHARDLDS